MHLQPAYSDLGLGPGAMPHTEESTRGLLSLPMFPEITAAQIDYVVERLRAHLGH